MFFKIDINGKTYCEIDDCDMSFEDVEQVIKQAISFGMAKYPDQHVSYDIKWDIKSRTGV